MLIVFLSDLKLDNSSIATWVITSQTDVFKGLEKVTWLLFFVNVDSIVHTIVCLSFSGKFEKCHLKKKLEDQTSVVSPYSISQMKKLSLAQLVVSKEILRDVLSHSVKPKYPAACLKKVALHMCCAPGL